MRTSHERRESFRSDYGDDDNLQDLTNDLDRALSLLGKVAGLNYRSGIELVAAYEQVQREVCEFMRNE